MKLPLLQVSRLTRSAIYQPVAAVLALLLMPTLVWIESTAGIPISAAARSFQSSAQIVQGCGTSRGNLIIQKVCVNGTPYDINGDLTQLEADAVSDYLTEIGAPASDASLIYSEGRTDLRNAIRGQILALLLSYIADPNSRTNCGSLPSDQQAPCQHKQMVYNWMQALIQQTEIAEYTDALAAYQTWQANPCNYVLDSAIAAQYNLSYNGAAACEPQTVAAAGPPYVPAASYFMAVGLEESYGAPSKTTPDFAAMVSQTGISMGEALGIATAVGTVAAGTTAGLIGGFYSQLFPFAEWTGDWAIGTADTAADTAAAVAESLGSILESLSGLSAALSLLGPPAIVLLCTITAGVAAAEVQQNQQNLDQLSNLPNLLAQAQNTPPDLNAFATDTSHLGTTKLTEALVAQTLNDVPSTAPLPAHSAGDPVFVITPGNGGTSTIQNSFSYDDWNGISWQATTSGRWFDLTCQGDSSGKNCPQADSFNGSIQYVDWSGKQRIASRFGNNFTIADLSPSSTEKPCPADPSTGLSTSGNLNACSSYVSGEIQYMYRGNPYTVSLSNQPLFNSPSTIYFTYTGPRQTATVTAAGNPAPVLSLAPGAAPLPAGVSFSGANGQGNGQFQYSGFASTPPGTYQTTLQAENGYGTTGENFTIVIAPQLQITSPASLVGNYGQPVSFLVTTTGILPMTLSIAPGILPTGLTFQDNGNGTATISGTPTEVDNVTIVCVTPPGQPRCTPPGITATNGQGSVTQPFTITINPPPQPALVVSRADFIDGIPNTFKVTTVGATTSVGFLYFAFPGIQQPSWLSFQDNGDGTATLSGTPPEGTSGSYSFELTPYANVPSFTGGGVPLENFYVFTLNFSEQPVFVNHNTAVFTVGDPGSFTISTNQSTGPIQESGALPNGLQFVDNGDGTATISGTPATGSGGVTTLQLSLTDSYGAATQALSVQVNEPLAFVSANWVNFAAGQQNSFPVQVSGYPVMSSAPAAQSQTAANYVSGAVFTVSGLPGDLSYSNLNPEGYNTGTLILSGNPSSSDYGFHTVTISADNGVGSAATQTLTLNIEPMPGDVNDDGAVNCTDFDIVKRTFGTHRGQPGYNPLVDLNNDGVINIQDLAIVSRNLPEGTVCH